MDDLINVENGVALLNSDTAKMIAAFEKAAKEIKAKEDELKKAILAEMEKKGIVKIDNDLMTITYIAPTDRETLNTKQLRAELPNIYDTYTEIKPVKASIRLKVK